MTLIADHELERQWLACVLLDPQTLDLAPIPLGDLHGQAHVDIAAAMLSLRAAGREISASAIGSSMPASVARLGGWAYLDELTTRVPTISAAPVMAKRIRDLARLRAMSAAAAEMQMAIAERDLEGATAAAKRAAALELGASETAIVSWRELLIRGIERIGKNREDPTKRIALGTPSIDRLYAPSPGHLVVVGGRPNVGKSYLVFAWHVHSARNGIPSGIVAIDDDDDDYAGRGLGVVAKVNPARLWNEPWSREIWRAVAAGAEMSRDWPIRFANPRSRSIDEVEAVVQRMVRVDGCRWISIDFLTAIRNHSGGRDLRERTNDTLQRIACLGRSLDVPIVLIAQLKRPGQAEYREPHLSDFRETGEIEEHAKAAILLWRKSDRAGEPVLAKNAKLKRSEAGARFMLRRDPESGLLVEDQSAPPFDAPMPDEDWS